MPSPIVSLLIVFEPQRLQSLVPSPGRMDPHELFVLDDTIPGVRVASRVRRVREPDHYP